VLIVPAAGPALRRGQVVSQAMLGQRLDMREDLRGDPLSPVKGDELGDD